MSKGGNTGAAIAIFGTLFIGYLYLSGKLQSVWGAISNTQPAPPVLAAGGVGASQGVGNGGAAAGIGGSLHNTPAAPPPSYNTDPRGVIGVPILPPGIYVH